MSIQGVLVRHMRGEITDSTAQAALETLMAVQTQVCCPMSGDPLDPWNVRLFSIVNRDGRREPWMAVSADQADRYRETLNSAWVGGGYGLEVAEFTPDAEVLKAMS